jgi:hypothetical protein
VKPEEAGADDEGKSDQEQPGVATAASSLADRNRERDANGGGREDDPEVRGVVLPPFVDPRRAA